MKVLVSLLVLLGAQMQAMQPAQAASLDSTSIVIVEMPTSEVSKILTSVGGTTTLNLIVRDTSFRPYGGYFVRLWTDEFQRNPNVLVDTRTDINGRASVSFGDLAFHPSTSDPSTQDIVHIGVFGPNNDSSNFLERNNTVSVFYDQKLPGALEVTGGSDQIREWKSYVAAGCSVCTGVNRDNDLVIGDGELGVRSNAMVPIAPLLRDAGLVPIEGYSVRYEALTPGVRFLHTSGATDSYDLGVSKLLWDSSPVYALAARAGVNRFRVSIGGHSVEVSFTAYTHPDFARTISLTSPSGTATRGQGLNFIAAVKDGFGNPVPDVPVLFTVLKGRSLTGASGFEVSTGEDGTSSIQLTSNVEQELLVEAKMTAGQTRFSASFPVATFVVGSGAVTATGTIKGKSQAELAGEQAMEAADRARVAAEAASATALAETNKITTAVESSAEQANKAAAEAKAAADLSAASAAVAVAAARAEISKAREEAQRASEESARASAEAAKTLPGLLYVQELVSKLQVAITELTISFAQASALVQSSLNRILRGLSGSFNRQSTP